MRVAVLGATGVLGRRVVSLLPDCGHEALALARTEAAAARLGDARTVVGDVWDPDFLAEQFAGIDAVLMLATAIPTGADAARSKSWKLNSKIRSELAPLVARIAREQGVTRLVQESVMYVYGDNGSRLVNEDEPVDPAPQAASCLVAEKAAAGFRSHRADAHSVVLRFGMFVAADSPHTLEIKSLAGKGQAMVFGDLHGYTTFVHIDDAAEAVVHALAVRSGTYNVGAEAVTKQHWLAQLAELTGRNVHAPPGLLRDGLPKVVPGARALARSIRLDSARYRRTGWFPTYPDSRSVWEHSL